MRTDEVKAGRQKIRRARLLRRNSTRPERILWATLAGGRLQGVKFRRQHPIGRYIVDFVSLERRLVVELDGGHHNADSEQRRDEERTSWLEAQGYLVMRFWNNDVTGNLAGVLDVIASAAGRQLPRPLSARQD